MAVYYPSADIGDFVRVAYQVTEYDRPDTTREKVATRHMTGQVVNRIDTDNCGITAVGQLLDIVCYRPGDADTSPVIMRSSAFMDASHVCREDADTVATGTRWRYASIAEAYDYIESLTHRPATYPAWGTSAYHMHSKVPVPVILTQGRLQYYGYVTQSHNPLVRSLTRPASHRAEAVVMPHVSVRKVAQLEYGQLGVTAVDLHAADLHRVVDNAIFFHWNTQSLAHDLLRHSCSWRYATYEERDAVARALDDDGRPLSWSGWTAQEKEQALYNHITWTAWTSDVVADLTQRVEDMNEAAREKITSVVTQMSPIAREVVESYIGKLHEILDTESDTDDEHSDTDDSGDGPTFAMLALTTIARNTEQMRDDLQALPDDRRAEMRQWVANALGMSDTTALPTVAAGGSPAFLAQLQHLWSLHLAKNAGYTGASPDRWANFRACNAFGISTVDGILTRMSDKWSRLQSVYSDAKNEQVGETIVDTLQDLAAYALILVCVISESEQQEA